MDGTKGHPVTMPSTSVAQQMSTEPHFSLATLFARLCDAVIVTNADNCVMYLNPAAEQLYGTRRDVATGQSVNALYQSLWLAPGHAVAAEASLAKSGHWRGESVQILRDGSRILAETTISALTDEAGVARGQVIAVRNVIPHHQDDVARLLTGMKDNRVLLQTALNSMDEGLGVWDADGTLLLMNPAGLHLVGLATVDEYGDEVTRVADDFALSDLDGHPIARKDWPLPRVLRGESLHDFTVVVRWHATGSTTIYSYSGHPFRDDAGQVRKAVITWQDVTAKHQAEREREQLLMEVRAVNEQLVFANLRNTEIAEQYHRQVVQMQAVLENLGEGVSILDGQGRILLLNRAAQTMLDVSGDQINDNFRHALPILNPNGKPIPPEERPSTRLIQTGESFTGFEFMVESRTGKRRHFVSSGSAVTNNRGQVELAIIVSRDVTELRALQSQEGFVSVVSHDLRTPLTLILGSAQQIQRFTERPDFVRARAEVIVAATRQMNTMIRDLVDSARLETGQVTLERIPLDVATFTREVLQRASLALDTGRVRVEGSTEGAMILADPNRLERIFTNLVSNALKYADGEVVLRVEWQVDEVLVSVADHGPGIASADQPHIFERYFRAEGTKRADGLGLGLYITRMLVEAHGGRIWVESEPGTGATFRFTLPAGNRKQSRDT